MDCIYIYNLYHHIFIYIYILYIIIIIFTWLPRFTRLRPERFRPKNHGHGVASFMASWCMASSSATFKALALSTWQKPRDTLRKTWGTPGEKRKKKTWEKNIPIWIWLFCLLIHIRYFGDGLLVTWFQDWACVFCGTSKAVKRPFFGILEIPAINPMVLRCFKTWGWRTWPWVYVCLCTTYSWPHWMVCWIPSQLQLANCSVPTAIPKSTNTPQCLESPRRFLSRYSGSKRPGAAWALRMTKTAHFPQTIVFFLMLFIWVWVNTYRYIFGGMNIHKSQLWLGVHLPGFWPIPISIYVNPMAERHHQFRVNPHLTSWNHPKIGSVSP